MPWATLCTIAAAEGQHNLMPVYLKHAEQVYKYYCAMLQGFAKVQWVDL